MVTWGSLVRLWLRLFPNCACWQSSAILVPCWTTRYVTHLWYQQRQDSAKVAGWEEIDPHYSHWNGSRNGNGGKQCQKDWRVFTEWDLPHERTLVKIGQSLLLSGSRVGHKCENCHLKVDWSHPVRLLKQASYSKQKQASGKEACSPPWRELWGVVRRLQWGLWLVLDYVILQAEIVPSW